LIDQRRLAVIDVRNDGDVPDFVHETLLEGEERVIWARRSTASNDTEEIWKSKTGADRGRNLPPRSLSPICSSLSVT